MAGCSGVGARIGPQVSARLGGSGHVQQFLGPALTWLPGDVEAEHGRAFLGEEGLGHSLYPLSFVFHYEVRAGGGRLTLAGSVFVSRARHMAWGWFPGVLPEVQLRIGR